ncbi:hypothetical protein AB0I94_06610 [Streptomyces sp. NPDC050147]|uniref:hypothetical protein n=1 Tax=Streptomyces sp. NPDC050147 TaxID=3155513 RepID=UPI003422C383
MDIDDLHRLGRLAEEILLTGGRYITGFAYEVGERGAEPDCAERIARILAVGSEPRTEHPA